MVLSVHLRGILNSLVKCVLLLHSYLQVFMGGCIDVGCPEIGWESIHSHTPSMNVTSIIHHLCFTGSLLSS